MRGGNGLCKANGHAQAAAVNARTELDIGTVALGDTLDDRQTETAAADAARRRCRGKSDRTRARGPRSRMPGPLSRTVSAVLACVVGNRDVDSAAGGRVVGSRCRPGSRSTCAARPDCRFTVDCGRGG